MKKNKLFAAVCSAAVTFSLAVCSVPASALSREDFSPQSLEAIDSVSSLDELLRLADGFVAPLALAKGPKQLCYLVSFEAEVSNIKKLSGNLNYPSNINVAECVPSQALIDSGNSDAFTYSAEQDVTDELNLAQFSSSEFTPVKVGEEITEYRLQGETALQSLGDISVSYSATKGSSGSTSSGVKIRKILMADANSDGVVNTVDSLCILQASSGKITLSGDAEIAADIDRDGRISNLDALMAVQYTSDKIKTLWSHGYLTKEENPNITSGNIYRLSCSGDGRNLRTKKSGSAGSLEYFVRSNLSTDMSQYDDFKYKFTYLGDGLYKITLKDNDTKALTASGTVKYTDYTGKDSQKWYVEGSDSSFYLVPLSRPTFFLTSGGKSTPKLGYNAYGGNWRLYGAEVTIYNYYDTGMLTRWNMTEAQMKTAIDNYVDEAIEFFKVYGVDIKKGPTVHIESIADKCTGASTNTQLNAKCEHYASTAVNHKDNVYLFTKLYEEYCGEISKKEAVLPIFWTGHGTWNPIFSYSENSAENMRTNSGFASGVFTCTTGVMMLNIGNNGTISKEPLSASQRVRYTVFHEIGHAVYGLPDTYCKGKSKENNNKCNNGNCYECHPETGRLKDCLMTGDIMLSHNKEKYLCDVCKAEAYQRASSQW